MASTWVAPNENGIGEAEVVYHDKPQVALCNVEISDDTDKAILILARDDVEKLIEVLETAKKKMKSVEDRMRSGS